MENPIQDSFENAVRIIPLLGALGMAAAGCNEQPSRTPIDSPAPANVQSNTGSIQHDFRAVGREAFASKIDDGECGLMEDKVAFSPDERQMKFVLKCIDGTRYLVIKTCSGAWQVDAQKSPFCDGTEQRKYYQVLQRR